MRKLTKLSKIGLLCKQDVIGLDKSGEEINFMKNTTLLSFTTNMFRQFGPLPYSV